MTEAATAPTLTKADKLKQANAARQAKLAEAKEAKAATKAAKKSAAPKREKVVIEPHECLDGCGEVLTTNAKFKPGHDAKLKSIIVKIERGELELDSLPGIASDVTKFKKGDLLKSKDEKGKVTSTKQLYICTESPVKLPAH